MIDQFLALYRRKDAVFGRFPEAQFRILLDLAENGDRDTTGLSMFCGATPTTALRHLDVLTQGGLIERKADPFDRRRTIYGLTDTGASYMNQFDRKEAA